MPNGNGQQPRTFINTGAPPAKFYERFTNNVCRNSNWPRITTRESVADFAPRDEGMDLLLINAPIREWSYPNIEPIGQGYVASVATMDGHRVSVLDLNAERREPWKGEMPPTNALKMQMPH